MGAGDTLWAEPRLAVAPGGEVLVASWYTDKLELDKGQVSTASLGGVDSVIARFSP